MDKNKTQSTDLKSALSQLEQTLDLYFRQKAPAIPTNIKEIIVNFAPWLTVIALVLSLPAILLAIGLGSILLPFSFVGGLGTGLGLSFSMIFLLVSMVLMALALPGLFKHSASAWRLMYYSTLVNAVYSLLRFNLGGLIIGTLLSLYVLFQVREYYK